MGDGIHAIRAAFYFSVLACIVGCEPSRHVAGDDFAKLYDQHTNPRDYYEFRGTGMLTSSLQHEVWADNMSGFQTYAAETIWTWRWDLPDGFPDHQQPKLVSEAELSAVHSSRTPMEVLTTPPATDAEKLMDPSHLGVPTTTTKPSGDFHF